MDVQPPSERSVRRRVVGALAALVALAVPVVACGAAPARETDAITLEGDAGAGPAPTPAVAPTASTKSAGSAGSAGRTVSPYFFGMHTEQPFLQKWPTVGFRTVRAWGTYPDVSWRALHRGPGRFDWTNLDNYVRNARAHHQQIVYVFGHVPAWVSSDPTGSCAPDPRGSCFRPDLTQWKNYVTAIAERYRGKIVYWELWNEPDAENFWRGTPAQMVQLAEAAYPIIEAAGGTVLSPSPQGRAGPDWMDDYLAAGGAPYADVNAFHSYLYAAPEALGGLVDDYRTLFEEYDVADRPLWDTEHSWGEPDSPFGGTQRAQAAWLARFQLLSIDEGIDRSIWYGWEHTGWGTLFDKETQRITRPGVAFGQVRAWTVGNTVGPCRKVHRVRSCPIIRADGTRTVAVWASSGTARYRVPAGVRAYRTVTGGTVRVTAGRTVDVGATPYLFVSRR